MKRTIAAMIVPVAALAVAIAIPATAETTTSDITIVHGIPGPTVDVYANGDLLIEDFMPMDTFDVALPAATYAIGVFAADADPETADAVIEQDVTVPAAGLDIDVVASLTADGTPVLAAFVNDTAVTGEGNGRVVVRHTAAAPAVDVRANGGVVAASLANPDEAVLEVPAATYAIDVVAAGGSDPVIGPLDLTFAEGTVTTVYAVGSLADDSLTAYAYVADVGARETSRVSGVDRFATAVAVSERAFPKGSDTVYLARADLLVDAVAGGALTDGPVLLVPSCGDVPNVVLEEIGRLDAANVIALGGPNAICDDVLEAAGAAAS